MLLNIIFILNFIAYSKESILVAFDQKGVNGITSQILIRGIEIAFENQSSSARSKYELNILHVPETLEEVQKILTEEIKKNRPLAILGAVSSNHAFMINLVSQKEKIPFVTPFATHPDVTKTNPYVVRTCFDDNLQTEKLAKFVYQDQKLKNGLVVYNEKLSYAIGVKNTFIDSFKKFGDTKIESLKFSNPDDFKITLFDEIEKLNPEFIILPSYQVEAANVFAKLSEKFKSLKVYGTDSWGGGRLFHSIIGSLPFKVDGFYVQHYSPEYTSKENQKFIELTKKDEFLKLHQTAAMLAPAAVGYDALNFIISADNSEGKLDLIRKLKNHYFSGATGVINLRGEQTPSKQLFIYQLTNMGEKFYVAFP